MNNNVTGENGILSQSHRSIWGTRAPEDMRHSGKVYWNKNKGLSPGAR